VEIATLEAEAGIAGEPIPSQPVGGRQ